MHVGAGHLDARQLGGARIDLAGMRDRDAELVLGLAGRDLCVRAGIDVRIDADGDARGLAHLGRNARQQLELGLGFDVEAEDVGGERGAQLVFRLADAGEQDLAGGDAGGQRALQFTARDHVGAGAELGQRAQHRLVGVRLHGVADQHLLAGEGVGEDTIVPLERRGRIAIERRADGCGQLGQVHRLGVQHAVAVVEMVHGVGSVAPAHLLGLSSRSGSRINGFFLPLLAAGAASTP